MPQRCDITFPRFEFTTSKVRVDLNNSDQVELAKNFLARVNDDALYQKGLRQDLRFRLKSINNQAFEDCDLNEQISRLAPNDALQCVFEHTQLSEYPPFGFGVHDREPHEKLHHTMRGSTYVDDTKPRIEMPLQKSLSQKKAEDGTLLDRLETFDDVYDPGESGILEFRVDINCEYRELSHIEVAYPSYYDSQILISQWHKETNTYPEYDISKYSRKEENENSQIYEILPGCSSVKFMLKNVSSPMRLKIAVVMIPKGKSGENLSIANICSLTWICLPLPHCARLHSPYVWFPDPARLKDAFLICDLGATATVHSAIFQGSEEFGGGVSALMIEYSDGGHDWQNYGVGLIDIKTMCEHDKNNDCYRLHFFPTIHSRYIRVRPQEYEKCSAFRVEFYGPQGIDDNKKTHLSLVSAKQIRSHRLYHVYRPQIEKLRQLKDHEHIIVSDVQQTVEEILHEFVIRDYSLTSSETRNLVHISFSAGADTSNKVLQVLSGIHLGDFFGSVTVSHLASMNSSTKQDDQDMVLAIEIHSKIKRGAQNTFLFSVYVFVAAVIAGCGLASNSETSVIASMLVSPIMGPVLAMTFACVTRDFGLFVDGSLTLCLALLQCILYGMLVGLIWWPMEGFDDWPTAEMSGRMEWRALRRGWMIAFVSGLGVAFSVLNDNISSLVGVAISAALLPPVVNTGLLIIYAIAKGDLYYVEAGCISFLLALMNIVLIAGCGYLVFEINHVYIPIEGEIKKVFDELKLRRHLGMEWESSFRQGDSSIGRSSSAATAVRVPLQDIFQDRPSFGHGQDPVRMSSLEKNDTRHQELHNIFDEDLNDA